MATTKQKQAVAKIIENHGNVAKSMREVGYTEASARNPRNLTDSDGYKEEAASFLYKMEQERDRLINAMSQRELDKVQYRDMTGAVDKLTKNIELLSGNDTEKQTLKVQFEVKFIKSNQLS